MYQDFGLPSKHGLGANGTFQLCLIKLLELPAPSKIQDPLGLSDEVDHLYVQVCSFKSGRQRKSFPFSGLLVNNVHRPPYRIHLDENKKLVTYSNGLIYCARRNAPWWNKSQSLARMQVVYDKAPFTGLPCQLLFVVMEAPATFDILCSTVMELGKICEEPTCTNIPRYPGMLAVGLAPLELPLNPA